MIKYIKQHFQNEVLLKLHFGVILNIDLFINRMYYKVTTKGTDLKKGGQTYDIRSWNNVSMPGIINYYKQGVLIFWSPYSYFRP